MLRRYGACRAGYRSVASAQAYGDMWTLQTSRADARGRRCLSEGRWATLQQRIGRSSGSRIKVIGQVSRRHAAQRTSSARGDDASPMGIRGSTRPSAAPSRRASAVAARASPTPPLLGPPKIGLSAGTLQARACRFPPPDPSQPLSVLTPEPPPSTLPTPPSRPFWHSIQPPPTLRPRTPGTTPAPVPPTFPPIPLKSPLPPANIPLPMPPRPLTIPPTSCAKPPNVPHQTPHHRANSGTPLGPP